MSENSQYIPTGKNYISDPIMIQNEEDAIKEPQYSLMNKISKKGRS